MAKSIWSNLGKLVFKEGFGIYLDADQVHIAKVGFGLLGPVLQSASRQPLRRRSAQSPASKEAPEFQMKELLADRAHARGETQRPWRRIVDFVVRKLSEIPVLLEAGVPDSAVYYSALPTTVPLSRAADLNSIIGENPKASFLASQDLVADWRGATVGDRNFILIGATKKSVVQRILDEFYGMKLQPIRVEAGPWAALRAAWHHAPPQSAGELEIRILTGTGRALVALSRHRIPLAWQSIALDQEKGSDKLYSSVQELIIFSRWKLKMPGVSQIVIQGDALPEEWVSALSDRTRLPVRRVAGPPYDGDLIAFGLALGAVQADADTLNLARRLQKPVPILSMLPRLELAIACLAITLVLISMGWHISGLRGRLRALQRKNAQAGWAIGSNAFLLGAMNQKLLKEATPLADYVADRIAWAPMLEEITALLPVDARLASVRAEDQIWTTATTNPDMGERFIVLRFAAQFPEGGKVPREIDAYLNALRGSPLFKKQLPKVQLVSISWRKEAKAEMAYTSVTCTPQSVKRSNWEQRMAAEQAQGQTPR